MEIQFSKYTDGLVPAIIQDARTKNVLMLGYMNKEAYELSLKSQKATFFSRSKKRIWVKGETSGNFLNIVSHKVDCDNDALLFKVIPNGPTCHKGTDTCWGEENLATNFLTHLENVIEQRKKESPENSYVASLFKKGINKIAQKVGEEAVETIIEAKDTNSELFLNESADLVFHFLVLLNAKKHSLSDVIAILEDRHQKSL